MPNLKIRKFNPNQMKSYRMILFVGKKGSGKSTLLKDIFFHLRHRFDMVVALAGTPGSEEMFREFIPDALIYNKINVRVVEKLAEYARIMVAKRNPRNILLLMDDCLGYTGTNDKKIFEHNVFREIANNQRHLHITFAVSLQYCMEMKPHLRSQIDYCFVFQDTMISNRKRLWQYFFGMFEDLDSFSKTLFKCTRDYECLVLDNVHNTGNFEDNLYYYKARTDIPHYQLGKNSFWFLSQYYAVPPDNYHGALFEELVRHLDVSKKPSTKDTRQDRLIVEKI